ncbi:sulfatase-like hydrolase/transferase [Halocatena salina]|uniref:Sulfatase-like hydrolase/transferase n=1 Tax=Halocatena salina TaxID=2934340 RepID=A0A8T9ZZC0_9EURY|nr:sulfatase-like hydrolase/transferase [Halocatena salina]UPM42132.1 sulfatase-like hydrolase/transferase [Halocatena salina]
MRNVVLIVLDTVRKDVFDEQATRLRSASGTSFEQARAASSWSVPSHTSIFTGQLPHTHGVHAESFDSSFSFSTIDRAETFLGDLPEYRTIGLSANSYMNRAFGFDSHFDAFSDFSIGSHIHESLFTEGLAVKEFLSRDDGSSAIKRYLDFLRACFDHDRSVKSLANGVWSQIGPTVKQLPVPEVVDDGAQNIAHTARNHARADEEPLFLFANLMDAHTPLRNLIQFDQSIHSVPNDWSSNEFDKWELNKDESATEAYTRNYRQLYGAAVEYLDRVVADLIDSIQRVTDRETSFVIVSDHGHNLGYEADDSLFHHTGSMTEGIMHTPCEIVNPPAGYPDTVSEFFSHLELGELLVRLAHEEPFENDLTAEQIPAETVGLLGTNPTWDREFTDDEYAHWNRMIRCVYHEDTKRQWNSLEECYAYELDADRPSWQRQITDDAAPTQRATALFEEELMAYKRQAVADTQDLTFDDSVEDQLQQLGYL